MDTKTFGMNSRDCGEILKKAGYIFDYDKWSWCKDGVVLFDGSGLNWAQSTYSAYGRFLLIPAPETPASTVESPTPDSANYRLEINGESQTYLKLLSPDNRVLFSDSHGLNEHWYELITSTLNKETESLRHQLAKAQADLVAAQNIIVQAGKDFEALKAENARMKEAIEVATEAMQQSIQDKDLVRSWQLQSWVSPLLKAVKPKAVQAPKPAIPATVSVNWTGRGLSTGKYPVLGHSQAGRYYVLDISTDPNTPMPKRVSFADCGV